MTVASGPLIFGGARAGVGAGPKSVRARLLEAGADGAELDRERGCRLSSVPGEEAARVVATSRNTDVGGEIAPRELTRAMLPALSPAFMSAMAALSSGESLGPPDLLPERLLVPVAPKLLFSLLALPLLLLLLLLRTLGEAGSVVAAGPAGALAFLCSWGFCFVAV